MAGPYLSRTRKQNSQPTACINTPTTQTNQTTVEADEPRRVHQRAARADHRGARSHVWLHLPPAGADGAFLLFSFGGKSMDGCCHVCWWWGNIGGGGCAYACRFVFDHSLNRHAHPPHSKINRRTPSRSAPPCSCTPASTRKQSKTPPATIDNRKPSSHTFSSTLPIPKPDTHLYIFIHLSILYAKQTAPQSNDLLTCTHKHTYTAP